MSTFKFTTSPIGKLIPSQLDPTTNEISSTTLESAPTLKHIKFKFPAIEGTESFICTSENAKVGTIIIWAPKTTQPVGKFLLCDGSDVSRTTYADLFDVLGTDYGTGDGSTTFTLPTVTFSGMNCYIAY